MIILAKRKWKSWIGLSTVMTLLCSIALIGCSSSGRDKPAATQTPAVSTAPAGPESPKEPNLELTLWTPPAVLLNPTDKLDWIQSALIPEWNKLHPTIKIKVETIPWEGLTEKVTIAIASKLTPNILLDYGGRVLPYAQTGAIEPLNNVIPKEDLAIFTKMPDLMKMTAIKDNIMVMPYPTTAVALLVNKTLWKDANAENLLPQDEFRTWTPEQFKAAMKAVASKDKGLYGLTMFGLNEQGDQLYNNTLVAFGAKLYNDDYTKYIAADNPQSEEAFKFIQSLVDEGLVTPNPESISAINAGDYFKQKKNGTLVASAGTLESIRANIKDGTVKEPLDYMFVNFPSPTKGQSALKVEFGNGAVFKSSDAAKVEWSKKFLIWMYTQNMLVYQANKYFNALGKEMPWLKDDKEMTFLSKLVTRSKEGWPVIDPGWGVKGYSEMRAGMFPEMQRMFIKQATPKQTIDTISKKNNAIIAKYNK